MAVYEVIGTRSYREHPPGEIFEATLDPDAEKRAIKRGAIRIIVHTPVGLDPRAVRPPKVNA